MANRARDDKTDKGDVHLKLRKKQSLATVLALCMVLISTAGCSIKYEAGREKQEIESTEASTVAESKTGTEGSYTAVIEVENYGTITIELDAEAAPETVSNFVSLAQDGFYDGLTFHRIIEGFMIQGGDPNGDGSGGSEQNVKGEFSANGVENNLSHIRGAVSMARSDDYDSASSQFFIVHEDSTYLDGDYAVFGYVTAGMDVVDAICANAEPIDNNGSIAPEAQPVITSIRIIEGQIGS